MKRLRPAAIVLALTLISGAVLTGAAHADEKHISAADVQWFADPGTAVGVSELARHTGERGHGVSATFSTTGLAAGETLTLWWVVFNAPEDCSGPCDADDIFVDGDPNLGLDLAAIAAADVVASFADGAVADADGTATMRARLREDGPVRESIFGALPTLKDAAGAEIHLVARSHGPSQPGKVHEQIGSFAGACDVFLNPPVIPDAPGECADIQFAIHQP